MLWPIFLPRMEFVMLLPPVLGIWIKRQLRDNSVAAQGSYSSNLQKVDFTKVGAESITEFLKLKKVTRGFINKVTMN